MELEFIDYIQLSGTVAFAVSGGLAGIHKKLDPFGVLIISFATALGGGMLRDVLIGSTPVVWMRDISYFYCVIIGYFISIMIRNYAHFLHRTLFLFDTIGLGVFTIVGIEKGLAMNLHPIVCVSLGTMTACFGGVVRDTLCGQRPVLFEKEIYATICIFGGILFFILKYFGVTLEINSSIITILIIITRLLVVKFNWSLKPFKTKSTAEEL